MNSISRVNFTGNPLRTLKSGVDKIKRPFTEQINQDSFVHKFIVPDEHVLSPMNTAGVVIAATGMFMHMASISQSIPVMAAGVFLAAGDLAKNVTARRFRGKKLAELFKKMRAISPKQLGAVEDRNKNVRIIRISESAENLPQILDDIKILNEHYFRKGEELFKIFKQDENYYLTR